MQQKPDMYSTCKELRTGSVADGMESLQSSRSQRGKRRVLTGPEKAFCKLCKQDRQPWSPKVPCTDSHLLFL